MALQDTDLFVVERDDINYKLTFEELKTDIGAVDPGPEPGDTTIKKPSVLTPPDGAGVGGDVAYFPETSAVTGIGNGSAEVNDFTPINTLTKRYEFICSDQGGAAFMLLSAESSDNVVQISANGGQSWLNETLGSSPLDGNQYVGLWNPTLKRFVLTAHPSGNGGLGKSYASNTNSYTGFNTVANVPVGGGDRGRTDSIAVDSVGNMVACGTYNTIVWSNNASSWTLYKADSSNFVATVQWTSVIYFPKVDKFLFSTSVKNSAGNDFYLIANSDEVKNKNYTEASFGQALSSAKFIGANDDYAFLHSSNKIYRSSDLNSWEEVADYTGAGINGGTVKGSTILIPNSNVTTYGDVILSTDNGDTWSDSYTDETYTFGSLSVAINSSDTIVAVNDRNSVKAFKAEGFSIPTTALTLTDANSYDDAGNNMGQSISETFTAGQTVTGKNTTNTYGADTPAFSTTTYSGTGADHKITTGIDNTVRSAVWIKCRNGVENHVLMNTIQNLGMHTNNTNTGWSNSAHRKGFDDTGFTTGNSGPTNSSGLNYVAWNFRAAPGFFDVVTYIGDSIAGRTVPHQLSTKPGMMFVKSYTTAQPWVVYHQDTGATIYGSLNDNNSWRTGDRWNNTEPTADEFTIGGASQINRAGEEYVAYLFADTPGKIKCGRYTGNAGTLTEFLGFKPGWLMIKQTDGTSRWVIFDNKRGYNSSTNRASQVLHPSEDLAEKDESRFGVEFADDRFRINSSTNGEVNLDQYEYIYMAISEDVLAGGFFPTGELTEDADPAGPTITLTNTSGDWTEAGLKVVNDTEDTATGPGASNVVFTSSEPKLTEGAVTVWGEADWELSTSSDFSTDLQEQSVSLTDSGVQTGPNFTLADGTDYYVRTKYNSTDPVEVSEVSDPNHFKTAGAASVAGGFSTTLYSGNSTTQTITTGIDNTVKSLVWLKCRDDSLPHLLSDTTSPSTEYMSTNSTDGLFDCNQCITSFTADGFTVGPDSSVNKGEFVAWNFKAGTGFMDIVQFSGDGTAGKTVPHSLASVPGMMIIKKTDGGDNWSVYHKDLGNDFSLRLNSPIDKLAGDWNNTSPTSTEFTLGAASEVNQSGSEYIAYLFADNPDAGIKCGSFAGEEGISIDCGFKPGWVLIKAIDGSVSWGINCPEIAPTFLTANADSNATSQGSVVFTDTGFETTTDTFGDNGANLNYNYIYVAIADTVDGTSFFNTNTEEVIKGWQITDQYGITPDSPLTKRLGIAELTEQPTGPVQAFVPQGDQYQPIADLSGNLARAQAEAEEANERLDAANASIDALRTSLEARITALEADHDELMTDESNNGGGY